MYNYLIIGAGLFGSVFAHEAHKRGKSVLVIDRRPHIAGNIFTEEMEGIQVHRYGAHIFHTSNKEVWGLCPAICRIQPVYQCAGGPLSGRAL